MYLSLSVRIAESFQSKEIPNMELAEVADLAARAGYRALCMRASQLGVHSPANEVRAAAALLAKRKLYVSMVTGDFDIVYNNEKGPDCLRDIGPYLDLAEQLGAPLLRVALKEEGDIVWARKAADRAAKRGLKLAHQCHTRSLFETVEQIEKTLQEIDRPNFGLIYEPANLEICGQDYGPATVQRLSPWIFNVYLQNQVLTEEGNVTLNTWCRGPVSLDLIPIHQAGGVDFESVFEGLHSIGYKGAITAHQSGIEGEPPDQTARATADYLQTMIDGRDS